MRGYDKSVPQWLSFEDALSAEEAAEKFPQYAYLLNDTKFGLVDCESFNFSINKKMWR